jgi:uncharacterized membrane protein
MPVKSYSKLKYDTMLKNLSKIKLLGIVGLFVFLGLSSCTKEEASNIAVDNYGSVEAYNIQKDLNAGIHGCVELVFPVSFAMPDSTVMEFESFEQARLEFQAWKEQNPSIMGRPRIIFPLELVTQDAEVLTVENRQQLREIIRDCRSNFPRRPRHFRPCFRLQFPVSIDFPDGDVLEVTDRRTMKQMLREWRRENRGAEERPSLVFPVSIIYEDGSETVINSREELLTAKKDCRD